MSRRPAVSRAGDPPGLSALRFVDPQLDPGRRHRTVSATRPQPLPREPRPLHAEIPGAGRSRDLSAWVGETHTTALLVLDGALGSGRVVHEWYADALPDGSGPAGPRDSGGPGTHAVTAGSLLLGASMTKSALAHLVGRAVAAGHLHVEARVGELVPELTTSGYAACTVAQLLTMTTGTAWVEDHRDPHGQATALVGCFAGAGASSRALLSRVSPQDDPGSRWEYCTADSQVLDWVREQATGQDYVTALDELWRDLGCVRDAVVAVDADGVALAGGGLAACAEDWLRLAALQLDGTAYDERLLSADWVRASSTPTRPWLAPGRLPSTITAHAGFGYHWWPLDAGGRRVVADGSRGQFGYVDRDLGVAVLKTSLWPYADPWVDRQQRDLCYLGLPLVASAALAPTTPEVNA